MWRRYNPNPEGVRVGDCAIRAISKALNQSWARTYCGVCLEGFMLGDMPSANHVWGAYLRRHGFERHAIPPECPDDYSVEDFCRDHPRGVYVLAISGHVVCVVDGDFYDSWDSGGEIPAFYWRKEG